MGATFTWDLGMVALSEYDADGWLGVSYDAYGEQNSGIHPAELHSPHGFYSRPLDPDTDGAGNPTIGCNVWWSWEGNDAHAMLGSDPRLVANLPPLLKGEAIFYGPKANFARCHADGSISMLTTDDGTVTGQSIFCKVSPDGFAWVAPWGKMTFDATGFHVITVSGASLHMGGLSCPAPLSALSSYAKLSAQMVQVEGSAVSMGATAGAPEPIAKATATNLALDALSAALSAVNAALIAIPAGVVAGASSAALAAAIGAATTAIGAAGSAITAAHVTIPSASSGVT